MQWSSKIFRGEPYKYQQSDNLHQSTNLGFAQNRSLVQLLLWQALCVQTMAKQGAQTLVEKHLLRLSGNLSEGKVVVLEKDTIGREWGWVFFYQNEEYLKTGDFRFQLAGNAPIMVNRNTGEIVETGTAHPVEIYI